MTESKGGYFQTDGRTDLPGRKPTEQRQMRTPSSTTTTTATPRPDSLATAKLIAHPCVLHGR